MKVQNIVRKAVALGSGAALVGTTLMGAFAYDLSTYPAKFIVDGQFDGKIVFGEKAATADVIGAVDIATSLQSASVSKVAVPGAAGKVSLSGDAFQLETSSDMLELREALGAVADTITAEDLAGLKSGKITTPEGSTNYAQYLRLQDAGSGVQDMAVNYVENTKASDRAMGDFLLADKSAPFLEWEIQFDEGFESEWKTDGTLKDMEDRSFNIMGTDFTVVSASVNSGGSTFRMDLMGGSVPDTLREGETKTYTIGGVDYEVTLVFVSDPSNLDPEVKFSVNGELTQAMAESDTDVLSGGLQIGVRDILVNAREGVASFYLGAHKLSLTDNNVNNSVFTGGNIEVNDDVDESNVLQVAGSFTATDKFEITSMKYIVKMKPAAGGETVFIPAGHGVRELVEEPELLLSDTLDIKYQGLTKVVTKEVSFTPSSGDDEYTLTFTNLDGKEYAGIPLLSTDGASPAGAFKFGEKTDDLVFVEAADTVYTLGIDDYAVVTSKQGGDAYKAVTNVIQYDGYAADQRTLTFSDLAGGKVSTVLDTAGNGTIKVGGHSYPVGVENVSVDDANVKMDYDGDGTINANEYAKITTWGGLVIDPLARVYNSGNESNATNYLSFVGNGKHLNSVNFGIDTVRFSGAVDTSLFDTAGGEEFNWTVAEANSDTELDVSFDDGSYSGPLAGVLADPFGEFQFNSEKRNADDNVAMTDYGILVRETDPADNNNAKTLRFAMPDQQIGAQVFVTLGAVTASAGGAGTADKINPIAVGLAMLDKDAPAVGTDNLIVVGGPCANTVAAALMSNPAVCTEGFTEGKAMIKAYEQGGKVAILVAGYSAQDTQGASRVLADYKAYSLKGSSVEVVATDLKNIKVSAVTN